MPTVAFPERCVASVYVASMGVQPPVAGSTEKVPPGEAAPASRATPPAARRPELRSGLGREGRRINLARDQSRVLGPRRQVRIR